MPPTAGAAGQGCCGEAANSSACASAADSCNGIAPVNLPVRGAGAASTSRADDKDTVADDANDSAAAAAAAADDDDDDDDDVGAGGGLVGYGSSSDEDDVTANDSMAGDASGDGGPTQLTSKPLTGDEITALVQQYHTVADSELPAVEAALRMAGVTIGAPGTSHYWTCVDGRVGPTVATSGPGAVVSALGSTAKRAGAGEMTQAAWTQEQQDLTKLTAKRFTTTLLERLLAPQIRKERNTLLQSIRHIVRNSFYDNEPPPTSEDDNDEDDDEAEEEEDDEDDSDDEDNGESEDNDTSDSHDDSDNNEVLADDSVGAVGRENFFVEPFLTSISEEATE